MTQIVADDLILDGRSRFHPERAPNGSCLASPDNPKTIQRQNLERIALGPVVHFEERIHAHCCKKLLLQLYVVSYLSSYYSSYVLLLLKHLLNPIIVVKTEKVAKKVTYRYSF